MLGLMLQSFQQQELVLQLKKVVTVIMLKM